MDTGPVGSWLTKVADAFGWSRGDRAASTERATDTRPLSSPPWVPEELSDRYELIAESGRGAGGTVYLARDRRLGRKVAIKLLSHPLTDSGQRRRFEREALVASSLNHPNIVTVHDVADDGKQGFLVMEWLEGQTLTHLCAEGPQSVRRALDLGIDIAGALGAAHRAGLIHRDVKPGNIMVTGNGAKVLDFGLARKQRDWRGLASGDSWSSVYETVTREGALVGTPSYMSPEQARGERLDARADVFSLGVVLYELLSGARPFVSDSLEGLLYAIEEAHPRPISELRADVPAALIETIERCLEKAPGDRFSDAHQVWAALVEVRESLEGSTLPAVPLATRRDESSRVRFVGVAAAVAVSLAAVGAGVFLSNREPPPVRGGQGSIAVAPLRTLSPAKEDQFLAAGVTDVLSSNLSNLPGLLVVPSVPSSQGEMESDSAAAAKALGVEYLLKGSLQRSESTLRVSLSVVEAESQAIEWSRVFDGTVEELFELQGTMVDDLVRGLERRGVIDARQVKARREGMDVNPTTDREAFTAYSEALLLLEESDVPAKLDRAVDLLERATSRDPEFALAHAALAEAYWEQFERTGERQWVDSAQSATEEAQEHAGEVPSVHHALAVVLHGRGELDGALEELEKELELDKASDRAWRLIGRIRSQKGDHDGAVEAFDKAIEIRPEYRGNHAGLGEVLLLAGRYEEAAEAFERDAALQPGNASALQRVGTAYHYAGELDKARENYERANKIEANSEVYNNLATIYYTEGKLSDSAEAFRNSIRENPNVASTHRNLGDVLVELGDMEGADSAYQRAIELIDEQMTVNPNDAHAMALKAVCLGKLGAFDEAVALARQAVEGAPNSGEILYMQSAVLARAGEIEAALDSLSKAVEQRFSLVLLGTDPDFDSLREEPRLQEILSVQQ